MISKTVLLAIPKEWNTLSDEKLFREHLEERKFDVITAFSYDEAIKIIQSNNLFAVIMTSDWGMKQDNGSYGLITLLKDKIPTYSIITKETQQKHGHQWFYELYDRPQHEYRFVPTDLDSIIVWLNNMKAS